MALHAHEVETAREFIARQSMQADVACVVAETVHPRCDLFIGPLDVAILE